MDDRPIPPELEALYATNAIIHAALTPYQRGDVSLEAALIAAVVALAERDARLIAQLQKHEEREPPRAAVPLAKVESLIVGGVVMNFAALAGYDEAKAAGERIVAELRRQMLP